MPSMSIAALVMVVTPVAAKLMPRKIKLVVGSEWSRKGKTLETAPKMQAAIKIRFLSNCRISRGVNAMPSTIPITKLSPIYVT